MSELAGFGLPPWLPARVQRALLSEDAAETREAKRTEQAKAERRERLADEALGAYRAAAEGRGEVVSAVALATGQAGRTLDEVFAGVIAAADQEDGRLAAKERKGRSDWDYLDAPEPALAGRSAGWPGSEYELNAQLRRAEDDRRWMVGYIARHNYPEALEAARDKSGAYVHRAALPMIHR